jgi:NADPH:quinone reductase-like Zn-dependent oxidoreductase
MEGYGPPATLRVREVPVPAPGVGEVLIRVRAAGVNPLDWHHARGEPFVLRAMTGLRRPKQSGLGADVAGVVESLGEGVNGLRPGDEVFGVAHAAFAEYAVGDQLQLALKPTHLSFEEAAALPIAGATALQGLCEHGGVEPGDRVLVIGAAGGVGTFAVQLAKAMGAEVTGVCSTAGVELVRSLGADHVIDYTKEPLTHAGEHYDVVLQIAGDYGLTELAGLLVSDGTLVVVGSGVGRDSRFSVLGPLWRMGTAHLVSRVRRRRIVMFIAKPRTPSLIALADHTAAGTVTPVLDSAYPLARAGEAILHLESGHAHGKTVLTI